MDPVKDYFDVTNAYVVKKLLIVLFPFTVKGDDWKRQKNFDMMAGGDPDAAATPRSDV